MAPGLDRFVFEHSITFSKTRYIIMGRNEDASVGHPLGIGSFVKAYDEVKDVYNSGADFTYTL